MRLPRLTSGWLIFPVLLVTLAASDLFAGSIYWGSHHGSGLRTADSDGTNMTRLVDRSYVQDVAVGHSDEGLFWTDPSVGEVHRANLDGTNDRTIAAGLDLAWGIALDPVNQKVYWADTHANRIQRADFDGTNREDVLIDVSAPREIEIDAATRLLYWVENGTGKIRRSDMDGNDAIDLVTGLPTGSLGVTGLTLDLINEHIYWAEDASTRRIGRASLDGSDVTEFFNSSHMRGQPVSVAVDPIGGYLFWCNFTPDQIRCINLDGSDERLLLDTGRPIGIVFVPEPSVILMLGSGCLCLCAHAWRRQYRNG